MNWEVTFGGIGIFLMGQFGLFLWHFSRMNTTLMFIKLDLERLGKEFERRDEQISLIWKKIDELQQRGHQ